MCRLQTSRIAQAQHPATSTSQEDAGPTPDQTQEHSTKDNDAPVIPPIGPTHRKPPYTFAQLSAMALMDAPKQERPLNLIYKWINTRYPHYKLQTEDPKMFKSWGNSVRHTMSHAASAFEQRSRKVDEEREPGDNGKGKPWILIKDCPKAQKLVAFVNQVRDQSTVSSTSSQRDDVDDKTNAAPSSAERSPIS